MARITQAAPHLSVEEVKTRLQLDSRPISRQRWLIIYNALVDPRQASEIAMHTGTTVAMVHRVIASYNHLGVSAVETTGKGGRRRQSMSLAEEQALLAPFFSSRGISENEQGPRSLVRFHRGEPVAGVIIDGDTPIRRLSSSPVFHHETLARA